MARKRTTICKNFVNKQQYYFFFFLILILTFGPNGWWKPILSVVEVSRDGACRGPTPCGYRARGAGNDSSGGHGARDERITGRAAGHADRRPGTGRSRAVSRVKMRVVILSVMILVIMIMIIGKDGDRGRCRYLPHRCFRAADVAFVVMIQKILLNGYWTVEDWTTADDSVGNCVWKSSIITKNYMEGYTEDLC